MHPSLSPLLLLPITTASALTLTLHLPASPPPAGLPPTTHASLSSLARHHSAPLSSLHTFVFHNVTPGSYLADVHCPSEAFRPLRIDVAPPGGGEHGARARAWETFRGNEWGSKGEEVGVGGARLELRRLGGTIYFAERPSFSLLGILKNPMILMGLVSMVLFIGMPKLVDSMDPETKAEFEASQRSSPLGAVVGGSSPSRGSFDMAAFLAGSGKKEGGRDGPSRRG